VLNAYAVDAGGSIFRSLDVEMDIAGSVQVEYWAEGAPRLRVTQPDAATAHSVYLPRLRGQTSYEYKVRPIHSDGSVVRLASRFGRYVRSTASTGSLTRSGKPFERSRRKGVGHSA
jgi:hypothetical protein